MSQPKFSIILPVRNGGEYFRECVESILNQKYRNFELVVLDNMSSDGSLEWVHGIDDARLIVQESSEGLTIEDSWARIVAVAKNEFMTITGHDDLFDENYLEVMSRLIDRSPDAALYQAHFRLIDSAGNRIRSCLPMPAIERAGEFLLSRLSFRRDSFGTGYIFRSTDYDKVGGIHGFKKLMFADDALWLQLMNASYKATADEECFSYRVHKSSTSFAPDWHSTFEALESYLSFLEHYSVNQVIPLELSDQLPNYLIFWFRWAYFSTEKESQERKAVEIEIHRLCKSASSILPKESMDRLEAKLRSHVFGSLAYYRWIGWRGSKWVKSRLLQYLGV